MLMKYENRKSGIGDQRLAEIEMKLALIRAWIKRQTKARQYVAYGILDIDRM